MAKELVQKLIPYVTTFSEAIPVLHKHGDRVTVGGEVTDILNIAELLQEAEEDFREEGVYITLDDGIGINQIVLPHPIYTKAQDKLKVGDVVLAVGLVQFLDTSHSYQSKQNEQIVVDNHKERTIRVLSYEVKALPDKPNKVLEPKE